jgi:hypothetical protein
MRIGRYDIIEELGRGAMGVVYKATDPLIGRIVAIKIILAAALDSAQHDDYKRRFFREAQLAGRVSHPGIVTIYDIAEDDHGQPYLVMEFVEGPTLQRMLRPAGASQLPQRLPLDRALDLAAQVAEALNHAHSCGVVHSDVKPANILVTPEGRVKVADFGIARFSDTEPLRTATVLGTPAYMAPEQLRGARIDARSDIFSLGAMLYWMVTGNKAFPGEDIAAVSFNVAYRDPPKPSEIDRDLPQDLDTVMSRCLAKDPAERYARARSFAFDLRSIAAGEPIRATLETPADERTATLTATLPLTFVPRLARNRERPLNKTLVTVAILALTLAVVLVLIRPAERIVFVPVPTPGIPMDMPLPAPEEPVQVEAIVPALPAPPKVEAAVVVAPRVTPRVDVRSESAIAYGEIPALPVFTEAAKAPAKPKRTAPARAPAYSALLYECKHNFRNATLVISSDGKDIEMALLERKGFWFTSSGGKVESQKPLTLTAGVRQLRVHVRSNDERKPFDQEATIDGAFPENGSLRLKIEVQKDELRLRWAGE